MIKLKKIKSIVNKLKCFFGFHKWFKYIPSERVCECCKKKQRYVCYPFISPLTFWETFKSEEDFKENSWFRYYEGKREYKDDSGNWYPYQREFIGYFYPKELRGNM